MQVANGDPVKVTIEGARFRRFKANARTRSWHGTVKSGDMYGYLCARSKGCAPLSLYSTPAVLHLRGKVAIGHSARWGLELRDFGDRPV